MLSLAFVGRTFFAARSVLPAASARYNSSNAEQTRPCLVDVQAANVALDPSQLPFPDTPDISQGPFNEKLYAASYVPGRGIHLPVYHPRTHSIPVAAIHFRSHHPELLELFTHFVSHAAAALGIPISRVIGLPTQRTLWTVPRSPFVHKKSQENFERRVYKRMIKGWDADEEVVERWVRYVENHAMGGVGMRIVRWERVAVGVGRKRLGDVAAQMAPPVQQEIKSLSQRIVHESS